MAWPKEERGGTAQMRQPPFQRERGHSDEPPRTRNQFTGICATYEWRRGGRVAGRNDRNDHSRWGKEGGNRGPTKANLPPGDQLREWKEAPPPTLTPTPSSRREPCCAADKIRHFPSSVYSSVHFSRADDAEAEAPTNDARGPSDSRVQLAEEMTSPGALPG